MEANYASLNESVGFSVEELDKLLDLANDIEAHPEKYAHKCDGKKLATCFTSQAQEPGLALRLPCLIWEARC